MDCAGLADVKVGVGGVGAEFEDGAGEFVADGYGDCVFGDGMGGCGSEAGIAALGGRGASFGEVVG